MADFPSWSDLFRIERDEALADNDQLSLEAVERDGTDANVMLAAGAAAGDEVVAQLTEVSAAQFLDSAKGQALDRLVWDRYGMIRKPSAPARGSAEFRTATPAAATFVIPVGTALQTAAGVQFITTASATFLRGSSGPVFAAMRSVLAGLDQQIGTTASGSGLTSITSRITGSPADLAVSNSLATAGADDVESDDALVAHARGFFTTVRKGTNPAIEQGALGVPGVRTATALDVLDATGRPARMVQLFITDAFTDVLVKQDVNPPTYQAQSQALTAAVFAGLSNVRAGGIFVQVVVSQVVMLPITLQLRFMAGVDADFVAFVARATVAASVNSGRSGEAVAIATLQEALRGVAGLMYTGDEVVSPAGDVVPRGLQVLRTSLALVQATPIQTDSSAGVLSPTTNPDYFLVRP